MKASAILVTRGRRAFALDALDDFILQTYEDRELIVVDDADDPSFEFGIEGSERIKYVALPRRLTIGAKRNIACELASGDVILHWDDDDWSGPRRIEDQVARLVDSGKWMTGFHGMVFQYRTPPTLCDAGKAWKYRGGSVIGASVCYLRSFWRVNPFSDKQIGEDGELIGIASRAGQITYVDAFDAERNEYRMVSFLHDKHTTERMIVEDGDNWRACVPVRTT